MTTLLRLASDADNVYKMSMSETDGMASNDAKYHSVQLTREANNVTVVVDNLSQRQLIGHMSITSTL